ncbi:YggS family pyridoxal phosphate-dependent enzyme [Pseudothermotoga sp. U03pept]|uniref:YggS family pyridoxal phosphate-dependent enzyme n=1 Tax=Pseudothermotoga sp. U03pept TaxID=3447012 RepID=UPI003F121C11
MDLSENLKKIKARIEDAARRARRDPNSVQLIAVVKEADLDAVQQIVHLGVKDLAENYAQQLVQKSRVLEGVNWHFIGRIQTNKIKYIVPICEYIHSVCRKEELLQIEKVASRHRKIQKILIEVNISHEKTKSGLDESQLEEVLDFANTLEHVKVIGLMTMAPFTEDLTQIRSIFRELRRLRDFYQERYPSIIHLSMGMTNDFEIAIEEGATMIRVGRAIFKGE